MNSRDLRRLVGLLATVVLIAGLAVSAPSAASASTAPVARLSLVPGSVTVLSQVTANPKASSAPRGVRTISIDWGDGSKRLVEKTKQPRVHAYRVPGTYRVTLRVTDKAGATARTARSVVVVPRPVAAEPTTVPSPAPTSPAPTTAPSSPGPSPTLSPSPFGYSVSGLSCPTALFCVAVGAGGYATTFDGSTWGTPAQIDAGRYLVRVSCPTINFCAASDTAGNVLTDTAGTWSTPVPVDTYAPLSVSCASATRCVAAPTVLPPTGCCGIYYYFDGTNWTLSFTSANSALAPSCAPGGFCALLTGDTTPAFSLTPVDASGKAGASVPATTSDGAPDGVMLGGLECVSSTFCLAIDGTGHEVIYNGTTFVQGSFIDGTSVPGRSYLSQPSCPTTSFCVVIDNDGHALTRTAGSWSAPVDLPVPPSRPALEIWQVSCSSTTSCLAASTAIDETPTTAGHSTTFTSGTWGPYAYVP